MDEELAQVFVGPPNEAELVRSMLEGNGIEAMIQGSGASGAYPINVGALAETHVLVAATDVETALRLLQTDERSTATPQNEVGGRVAETYAFRRSVLRWVAMIILIVTIASLVTNLDLG